MSNLNSETEEVKNLFYLLIWCISTWARTFLKVVPIDAVVHWITSLTTQGIGIFNSQRGCLCACLSRVISDNAKTGAIITTLRKESLQGVQYRLFGVEIKLKDDKR